MSSKQNPLPAFALLGGAFVWGVIWYPYRVLQQAGVNGDLATFASYMLALVFGLFALGPVWRELRVAGWLGFGLIVSAGWANFGYVLATLQGEVMRVLLLFYLAPLWTVFFAHFLLGEKLDRYGAGVIALSLSGAFVMLWQPDAGLPLPQNMAEWYGLTAGMCFALTNVLVRRVHHLSIGFKSAAIWIGTALVTGIALMLQGGLTAKLLSIAPGSWGMLLGIGLVLCATSLMVQYGLTHTPANRAIVIFLSELVFAAAASFLLAGERMDAKEVAGALLIVSASLLSGKMQQAEGPAPDRTT